MNMLDHMPPADVQLERGLCAACIVRPETVDAVAPIVTGRQFYDTAMATLFDDLVLCHQAGKPIEDARLLVSELRGLSHLEAIGGCPALYSIIAEGDAHRAHGVHYARRIARFAELRRQIQIAGELAAACYDPAADPAQTAANAEARLMAASAGADCDIRRLGTVAQDVLASIDEGHARKAAVYTGIPKYDEEIGPWRAGDLVTLAARTSIGKTAFCLQIALHQARRMRPTLLFSLEMRREELIERLLCGLARVNPVSVRTGTITPDERRRLIEASKSIHDLPLHIPELIGRKTCARIRAIAARHKAQHGLSLLCIDYLEFIDDEDEVSRNANKAERIAAKTRALKNTARDLGVPLLCLAQLNRQADHCEKPILAHLKDSSSIEQDSDVVLLLHRQNRQASDAELLVAKNRVGQTGIVKLSWAADEQRFDDASLGIPWKG